MATAFLVVAIIMLNYLDIRLNIVLNELIYILLGDALGIALFGKMNY